MTNFLHIKSISQLHQFIGKEKPKHPAISFIRFSDMEFTADEFPFDGVNVEFYVISFKTTSGQLKYGRDYYDFEEGTMTFTAPNQVLHPSHLIEDMQDMEGWSLFFHPDILFGTELGDKMGDYHYFSYKVNEALHLSEVEQQRIQECIRNIVEEYSLNIDQHTQELIVSNLKLLLDYCKRFYDRQFYTRTKQNKEIAVQVEQLLKTYFNSEKPANLGLPTVKYCAEQVNLSPNYLSDVLKKETGKNTKEHIDYYLINKAKKMLLGSSLNVSEIAYDLGFEQPKSFSKLFKKREGISPKEFRTQGEINR